jgi:dTDP-4-amino-4,6-dideoxygalactose transaminase
MHVPLVDLRAQHAAIAAEVMDAIRPVIENQQFILGEPVKAFESAAAAYVGTRHAVGVSSGSDALLLALEAVGAKAGRLVLTTPFTFFATAGSASRLGLAPRFADILPDTFNLSPAAVEARIAQMKRSGEFALLAAIVAVDLFGQCADWEALEAIARREGVPIVEDAAQAIGATWKGRRAGTFGNAAAFSFFPTKNLGGWGDGGMVTTDDDALATRIAMARNHGSRQRYRHEFVGMNGRLDAIQAAVLRVKLRHLDAWLDLRRAAAKRYERLLREAGIADRVVPPATHPSATHTWHQYVVRVRLNPAPARRDELKAHLAGAGVASEVYYPIPLHLQECYRDLGYRPGDLPEAERAAREVLALPIFPEIRADQQEWVVDRIADFVRRA